MDGKSKIVYNIFMSLTKYKEGSLFELLRISFPLMISSLSLMAMLFVDRLMLAHFSISALNAAVSASTSGWAFIVGVTILAGISEVFVAQYNGAKCFQKIGQPVWQMLWLSIFSIPFFVVLAVVGPNLFFSDEHLLHREYFFWMTSFGWASSIYAALTGFFIGRGKTLLITLLALGANLVNGVLDWAFIFGIEGWIPVMGVKGAAIATSLSSLFQALVLLSIFLKKNNREEFSTHEWAFSLPSFLACVRVGLPIALFVVVEILGWAAYYGLLTWAGEDYITVAGICQSLLILLWFFNEGVQKGVTAIAGNLIGAKKAPTVVNVVFSAVVMQTLFFVVAMSGLYLFIEDIIYWFAGPLVMSNELFSMLKISLRIMVVYLYFEGIRFSIYGALTAAGDTFFLFLVGVVSIWVFLVLPIWFFVVQGGASIVTAMVICAIFSVLSAGIYVARFFQGKWAHLSLT